MDGSSVHLFSVGSAESAPWPSDFVAQCCHGPSESFPLFLLEVMGAEQKPVACSEPCGMFWLFCMLSLICTRQVDSVHFEQSIGIVETPCIRERKGCFAAKIWIPYPRRQTHLLSRKLNAIITSAFPSLIVRDTVPHSQSDASDRRECCALNKLIEESALNKGCRQSFWGCRSVGRVLAAHA